MHDMYFFVLGLSLVGLDSPPSGRESGGRCVLKVKWMDGLRNLQEKGFKKEAVLTYAKDAHQESLRT